MSVYFIFNYTLTMYDSLSHCHTATSRQCQWQGHSLIVLDMVTRVQTRTVLWIYMFKMQIPWKLKNPLSGDPNFTMSLSLLTPDRGLTLKFERSSHQSTPTTTMLPLALLPILCDIFLHFCEHYFKGRHY